MRFTGLTGREVYWAYWAWGFWGNGGKPLARARYPNPNPRPLGRVSEVLSDGRLTRIRVTLTLTLGASGNRGENANPRWG